MNKKSKKLVNYSLVSYFFCDVILMKENKINGILKKSNLNVFYQIVKDD